MKDHVGIIGGSGFYDIPDLQHKELVTVHTPYGEVDLFTGIYMGKPLTFVCRHGSSHNTPPHKINYRANIYALQKHGVGAVVATNAVGGISQKSEPGRFVVPDQVIDYSWGREHTFFDEFSTELAHVDFSQPFDASMRNEICSVLSSRKHSFSADGVYGCTQGPRMETVAEVKRMHQDGCDMSGMTLMPEAALAREAQLSYASLCFSVNWSAGINGAISMMAIRKNLNASVSKVRDLLPELIERIRSR